MERHEEREQTFDVDGAFSLAELFSPLADAGAQVGDAEIERLRATYFDTDDLALLHAGITLRRRVGGHDAGWHLKLPGATPGERTELRLPLECSQDAVPSELADLLTARLGGRALKPVLALETERIARVVRGDDDGVEVADDHVVAERLGSGTVETWREIEVERLGPDGELAEIAARLLERAGAHPAAVQSKAARALGVAPGTAPPRVPRGSRAGTQILGARLAGLFGELTHQDLALRQGHPEAVHDLRVAIRRTRSLFRTFGPLLDKGTLRPLASELSWLGDVLGAARDQEVLAAHTDRALDALAPDEQLGPVRATLGGALAGATAAARDELLVALRTERYAALCASLAETTTRPPLRKGVDAAALRRCVRREIRGALSTWDRARRTGGAERDAAFHEARKVAKRVRYAAETVAPFDQKAAARLARRFADLQELLGERHDAVVARAHYFAEGARAGERPGESGFTYGILAERERTAIAAIDAALPALWRRAGSARLRRFLA